MPHDDDMITIKGTVSAEDAVRIIDAAEKGETVTLKTTIQLSEEDSERFNAIAEAPAEAHLPELLELAGLDPSEDLRGMDFKGATWGAADLSGYDLSRCNLTGNDFSQCEVEGMVYEDAVIDDVIWPEGYTPATGYGMRH